MESITGVVQDIIVVGDGEYRVTFRAYTEADLEAHFWEKEDVPFTLYSMIARWRENNYSLIAEGPLTDCINILRENESVETVQKDEIEKWRIGALAEDIASSLAEGGMLVPVTVDEEN